MQTLSDAGFVAYVVGGSVRDFLLGKESKDHDLATSAGPDELCALFPRAVTVGKAFGVIKVPVNVPDKDAPVLMEIATFREDLEYLDHRHPKGVRFSGPEEDARRRDFTINALFYDPKTSKILDVTGGVRDLRDKVVRAIGVPQARFREDALRLLRAVRFAARLGFEIEPETAEAIDRHSKLISSVSAERVRDELTLMLTGPRPADALETLSRLGLLERVLPELEALGRAGVARTPSQSPGHPWQKTLAALRALAHKHPSRSPELAWAAALLEVGRAGPAGAQSATPRSAGVARAIATRLKMSRAEIDRIFSLIEEQEKFREVFKMRESTLQRFIREPGFEELLELHGIEATVSDGNLAYYEYCRSRFNAMREDAGTEATKLVDGKDLIQLGLSPGPGFSEILRVIEDLALERKLRTKEEALEYIVGHFVK